MGFCPLCASMEASVTTHPRVREAQGLACNGEARDCGRRKISVGMAFQRRSGRAGYNTFRDGTRALLSFLHTLVEISRQPLAWTSRADIRIQDEVRRPVSSMAWEQRTSGGMDAGRSSHLRIAVEEHLGRILYLGLVVHDAEGQLAHLPLHLEHARMADDSDRQLQPLRCASQ